MSEPIRVRDLDSLARAMKATVEMLPNATCAATFEFSMLDVELNEPVDIEIKAWRCPNPDCDEDIHVVVDRVRRDRSRWNQERSDEAMFGEDPHADSA